MYLDHIDVVFSNEINKNHVKVQYDWFVQPRVFHEGDLVLVYDQDHEKLGASKLEPLWYGPYIVKYVLQKGSYELADHGGNLLSKPYNWIYLKKNYV